MKKEEIRYYLKGRWEQIREIEIAELKRTPYEVRFLQTAAMIKFANSLPTYKTGKEKEIIYKRWNRLRSEI